MHSFIGSTLILWTVRISVALYAVAAWRYLFVARSSPTPDRWYRAFWGMSWALCVIHVCCAFHFQHLWSHAAAVKHTAEMTERVVGIHWGGGLYINYLFLAWWGVDVLRLLAGLTKSSSPLVHAVAAFMMFNATAVFGPGWWWAPVATFAAFMAISVQRNRVTRPDSPEFPSKAG